MRYIFFVKQKTVYEMRISDWSSDVCSSDLGLTLRRLPVFVWSMLVTSVLNLIWVPVIGVAMVMGLLDRLVPTNFFSAQGLPLLWQDLFWLFGHPEVYIIMLPAWGMWLEIVPVFSRKSLFGYNWALAGFFGVLVLSSYVWTHHMFTTTADVRLISFMTTTELISIPPGFMYIAAIGKNGKASCKEKVCQSV